MSLHHWSLNIQGTGNAWPKEIKLGQNRGLIQSGWEHSLDQLEILVGECLACKTSKRAVCRGDPLPLYQTVIQNPRKGVPPSPALAATSPPLSNTHPSLVLWSPGLPGESEQIPSGSLWVPDREEEPWLDILGHWVWDWAWERLCCLLSGRKLPQVTGRQY